MIAAMAAENKSFHTLVKAIENTKLSSILNKKGPLTVFAPTNDAFKDTGISNARLSELFCNENKEVLEKIILMHVIKGIQLDVDDLNDGETNLETAGGEKIILWKKDGMITIHPGGAKIVKADIKTRNGVIYGIDKLIQDFPIGKKVCI